MTRTSKSAKAKGNQLNAAREAKLDKQVIAESDSAWDTLWSNFNESKAYAQQLEQQLADQTIICTDLQNNFNASQNIINALHTEILLLKSRNGDIYHQLRMEKQRCKRAISKHG
jgi:hypothetical protein